MVCLWQGKVKCALLDDKVIGWDFNWEHYLYADEGAKVKYSLVVLRVYYLIRGDR